MKASEYNTILQRLDKIDAAVNSIRALILGQMENEVDSSFYQEQISKLRNQNRDLEYQQALAGKYTIDHKGTIREK